MMAEHRKALRRRDIPDSDKRLLATLRGCHSQPVTYTPPNRAANLMCQGTPGSGKGVWQRTRESEGSHTIGVPVEEALTQRLGVHGHNVT